MGNLTHPLSLFKICQGLNGSWASSRVQTKPTHIDAGCHPGYVLFHPGAAAGVDTHCSTILEQARPQSQWYSCWMMGTGSCTKSPAKKRVRAQTLCTVPTSANPTEAPDSLHGNNIGSRAFPQFAILTPPALSPTQQPQAESPAHYPPGGRSPLYNKAVFAAAPACPVSTESAGPTLGCISLCHDPSHLERRGLSAHNFLDASGSPKANTHPPHSSKVLYL